MKQYRCWLLAGGKTVLRCLLLTLVFFAVSLFSSGMNLAATARNLPYFPVMSGMMFGIMFTLSAYSSYLPVFLSFGSTRRSALIGLQLMSAYVALCSTALTLLLCLLSRETGLALLPKLPALFFLQLAMGLIGHLLGCAGVLSPKWGTALTVAATFLVCGCGGGLMGYLSSGGLLPTLPAFVRGLISLPFTICLAAALLPAALLLQRRTLRAFEVRL